MSSAEWSTIWNNLETAPKQFQSWDMLRELWANYRKRWRAASSCNNFPLGNHEWPIPFEADSLSNDNNHEDTYGIIGTVTTDGTTISITDASMPASDLIDDDGVKRFYNFAGTWYGQPILYAPGNYRIVINCDDPDPSQVVEADITDTPDDSTFEVDDDGTWLLNGDLDRFNGKRYCIIKSSGISWADRWPPRPVWTLESGSTTTTEGSSSSSNGPTELVDTTKNWADDKWTGKDLMVQLTNGKWVRINISGNTSDTLEFDEQEAAPSGDYWITPEDEWWMPDNVAGWHPFTWYRGPQDSYWSHYPDGTVAGAATIATDSIPIDHSATGEIGCNDEPLPVYDYDQIIGFDSNCNPDRLLCPDLWKCCRAIQAGIDAIRENFIMDYDLIDADHRTSMTPGTLPMLMRQIGGNYQQFTIESVDSEGVATLSGDFTFADGETTRNVTFTQFDAHGLYEFTLEGTVHAITDSSSASNSTGIGTSTLTAVDHTFNASDMSDGGDVGKKVGITMGWTRREPRRVQRIYPRIIFVPDMEYDSEGDPVGLVQPPTSDYPGRYVVYSPDTHYSIYEEMGRLTASGRKFQPHEWARYVGCNTYDPTTFDLVGDGDVDNPDPDPTTDFYDASYVGLQANHKQFLEPTITGTVSAATSTSLTDDSAELWVAATPRITHMGTADSGGTNTLGDSTMSSDGFWTSTKSDGTHRFVGMTLEVMTHDGSSSTSESSGSEWEKQLITSVSGTTITVAGNFSVATNGLSYRIREPAGIDGDHGKGVMAYWQNATLRVTSLADKSQHDFIVNWHDDTSFYFDSTDYTPAIGDEWAIIIFRPGDVLQWNDGSSSSSGGGGSGSGSDVSVEGWARPNDEGVDTDVDLASLSPTYHENYGRWCKGDAIYTRSGVPYQLVQMKKAIDALHLREVQNNWDYNAVEDTSGGDGDDPEYSVTGYEAFFNWYRSQGNNRLPTSGNDVETRLADAMADLSENWNPLPVFATGAAGAWELSNQQPSVSYFVTTTLEGGDAEQEALAGRVINHLVIHPDHCRRFGMTAPHIQAWLYMTIDESDSDEGFNLPEESGDEAGRQYRELATEPFTVSGGGYTGANLAYRKWTRVYNQATSLNEINLIVGNTDFPEPAPPTVLPDYDPIGGTGTFAQAVRSAYVYAHFAVADWQPIFDTQD